MSSFTDHLLSTAQIYADHRRLSLSRVSTLVFGDGRKLRMLREGGDLTTCRFEVAMVWLAAHWPADVPWPTDVPRPDPSHEGDPT